MAGTGGLANHYYKSMQHHSYGYALYEPAPFTRLRPGSLGYLDEHHRWRPILDLLDSEALERAGYSSLGDLRPAEPNVCRFGPKTSNNTTETSIDLEAGVGAAAMGLPVDVNGALKFSTSSEFGAVLVCENDVVEEGFDLRQPFNTWLENNAKALFKEYPELKEHGLYAVMWTYSTTGIHLSVWNDKSNHATVGVKVGVAGAGNIGPKTEYVRGQSSSGWTEWTDQKRVIFFTGVFMRTNLFGWAKIKKKKSGPDKETKRFNIEGDEGEESFRVFLEPVGNIEEAKAHSTDESV
ncbi:hypothetical protein BKA59DRAFT_532974 [Fusarium tricinctum]|uniref:Uncharacterized protein n=1 Tax=Fusarium tricinctum TaxID=61284 RepID=A0A8K0RR28_9HYPO|nr:hypothetical protein BKA59DRAFT_532974 [Fusarium tricinctum]